MKSCVLLFAVDFLWRSRMKKIWKNHKNRYGRQRTASASRFYIDNCLSHRKFVNSLHCYATYLQWRNIQLIGITPNSGKKTSRSPSCSIMIGSWPLLHLPISTPGKMPSTEWTMLSRKRLFQPVVNGHIKVCARSNHDPANGDNTSISTRQISWSFWYP